MAAMRKTKLPPSSPDDTEQAFYDALQHADLERLMACWADEDDIVCVHPGGPRMVGHAAVRAAFEALFANGSVKAHPEKVRRLDAGSCSVHSVVERVEVLSDDGLQHAWVVATNVYAKNPASRTITVSVSDKIYKGLTPTTQVGSTANSGEVDVAAKTEVLVLTNQQTLPASDGDQGAFNDVATATYIDKATGIAVPGNTTATASAATVAVIACGVIRCQRYARVAAVAV